MQASRMKTREEHETVVSDGDVLSRVLETLGLTCGSLSEISRRVRGRGRDDRAR